MFAVFADVLAQSFDDTRSLGFLHLGDLFLLRLGFLLGLVGLGLLSLYRLLLAFLPVAFGFLRNLCCFTDFFLIIVLLVGLITGENVTHATESVHGVFRQGVGNAHFVHSFGQPFGGLLFIESRVIGGIEAHDVLKFGAGVHEFFVFHASEIDFLGLEMLDVRHTILLLTMSHVIAK